MMFSMAKKVFMTPGSPHSERSNFWHTRFETTIPCFPDHEFWHQNRVGDAENFFGHGFLPQVIEFWTDFWSVQSNFRSRLHFAPRWVREFRYETVLGNSHVDGWWGSLWCLWLTYLRWKLSFWFQSTIPDPEIQHGSLRTQSDNLEPTFRKAVFPSRLETFPDLSGASVGPFSNSPAFSCPFPTFLKRVRVKTLSRGH